MARNRSDETSAIWSRSGEKRTHLGHRRSEAIGPKPTSLCSIGALRPKPKLRSNTLGRVIFMAEARVEGRLVAIPAADISGYSYYAGDLWDKFSAARSKSSIGPR